MANNFASWLSNKKASDYWFYENVSDTYAINIFNEKAKKLSNGSLRCKIIVWFITNKCNINCFHCGVSANDLKYKELSLDEIISCLPKLSEIGVSYITLSGGEPFLRKDIFEIIKVLKYSGFKVGIVTNGHYILKHYEKLKEDIPDSINISIDGLEKTHNSIRNSKGSFKKAVNAISIAKELGVKIVTVNTCVYPENFNELEELKNIIFKEGVDNWLLRPIAPSGRARKMTGFELSDNQIIELLDFIKINLIDGYEIVLGADLGYLGVMDSIIRPYPFSDDIGWDTLFLLPNGDIKGFEEPYLPIEGNIIKDSLKEIWLNNFKYYRERILPDDCLNCKYLGRCNGGLIANVENGRRCIKPVLNILETRHKNENL